MADMIVVQDTYLFLVETAMLQLTTTYGEIIEHLERKHRTTVPEPLRLPVTRQVLEDALGSITEWCNSHHTPILTSLVVRASGGSEGEVGSGFWASANLDHLLVDSSVVEKKAVLDMLQHNCHLFYRPIGMANEELANETSTALIAAEGDPKLDKAEWDVLYNSIAPGLGDRNRLGVRQSINSRHGYTAKTYVDSTALTKRWLDKNSSK